MAVTTSIQAGVSSSTPTLLVNSDTVDRHVRLYSDGYLPVRIGFTSAQVGTTTDGFVVPRSGIDFVLQSGDEIWAAGNATASFEMPFLFIIVTK